MNTTDTPTTKTPTTPALTIAAALVAVLALVLAILALSRTPGQAEPASAEDRSWDCSAEVVRIAPAEGADQDLDRRVDIVTTAVHQALGDAAVTVEVLDTMPEPEVLRDRDTDTGVNLLVDAGPRDQGYVIERADAYSTQVGVTELVDRTLLAGALRPHLPACAQTEEG